jgi:hypothetical protein
MFDALTRSEALELRAKLAGGAQKSGRIGQVLGDVALADFDAPDYAPVWNRSARYWEMMRELYAIRDELIGLVAQ